MDPHDIAKMQIRKICFIGGGFMGGTSAAVFAKNLPTVQIVVIDNNDERVKAWNSDVLPVREPGLLALMKQCRAKDYSLFGTESVPEIAGQQNNLHFLRSYCGPADIDLIFICVGVSQCVDHSGNMTQGYCSLANAVRDITKFTSHKCIIVEKSTLHAGTAGLIANWLADNERPTVSYVVLSNPEFLAEGSALSDLQTPDRVLIGSSQTPTGLAAATKLSDLYQNWVPRERIITTDSFSSELSKLCANALLAQRVSSINAISMMCERSEADVREIGKVAKSDHRIGEHMLDPSPGFGGSCFAKDLKALQYLAGMVGLPEVSEYWGAVLKLNNARKLSFAQMSISKPQAEQCGRGTVAIFGVTFKANTNDIRDSPAIDVIKHLRTSLRQIRIYDPHANYDEVKACFEPIPVPHRIPQDRKAEIVCCEDPYETCEAVSAIIVLTEWDEFCGRSEELSTEDTNADNDTQCAKEEAQDGKSIKSGNGGSCDTKGQGSNAIKTEVKPEPDAKPKSKVKPKPEVKVDVKVKIEDYDSEMEEAPGPEVHVKIEDPTPPSAQPTSSNRLPGCRNPNNRPVDWQRVSVTMAPPHLVFDGRDIVDDSIEKLGFEIVRMGKKPA